MMSVSMLEQRRALAPAAWRQWAVTLLGRKPSEGPRKVTAVRSVVVISLGLIKDQLGAT